MLVLHQVNAESSFDGVNRALDINDNAVAVNVHNLKSLRLRKCYHRFVLFRRRGEGFCKFSRGEKSVITGTQRVVYIGNELLKGVCVMKRNAKSKA
jgi:hypothetical protein